MKPRSPLTFLVEYSKRAPLAAVVDAIYGQKLRPESLRPALLVAFAFPARGKYAGAVLDFVPIHLNLFRSMQ